MAPLILLYIMTLIYIFRFTNFEKWILKTMRARTNCYGVTFIKGDICYRMGTLRMLYSVILTYIFKVSNLIRSYLGNGESYRKIGPYDFCRFWYSPSNGVVVNATLRDLDLHFPVQTFSCYAFANKIAQGANVTGRFSSTRKAPPLSCSCFHTWEEDCWLRILISLHL